MSDNANVAKNLKVVHLESQGERVKSNHLSNLPNALSMLRDKSKLLVLKRVKLFFDKVDDSLFELADKAASNQEQNLFFDSMREIRIQRRRIEKNMALAINDAFNSLMHENPEKEKLEPNLTGESLSLVETNDLEESVATKSSISRAHSEFAESIQLISLRLDSLVPRKVYQKNNPIGPEVLCTTFMAEARTLDLEFKAKLVLFKLFDRFVMSQLGDLYEAANQVLVENNVLPSLSLHASRREFRARPESASGDEQIQQSKQGDIYTESDVLQALEEVLGGELSQPSPNSGVRELLNHLSLRQKQVASTPEDVGLFDVNRLLNQIHSHHGAHASIRRMDEEVINLVNMLFEFILRDQNLAEPMKVLLGRMQIPLIKVALVDKCFFARGGHSARRLLNDMANAALGWNPVTEGEKSDPLYSKMESVVKRLTSEFDTDVGIFDQLLDEFNTFLAREKRRAALLERRTLDAEGGRAKTETARTVVAAEIELRVQGKQLPEVVEKMIDTAWQHVLFMVGLKHGFESSQWYNALLTLEDLIWSVAVPRNVEDRRKLIRLVPDLINRLRDGMDLVSFNPFDMADLFKALEAVHLSCIRGEKLDLGPEQVEAGSSELPLVSAGQDPFTATLDTEKHYSRGIDDVHLNNELAAPLSKAESVNVVGETSSSSVDSPFSSRSSASDIEEIYMKQVANFVQGAWFEMLDEEGTSNRCRLAAVINPTGKYIFVNRNGMKVAEKTQHELAVALKLERVRALDNTMLFDRALETVVTSLRKSR